MRMGPPDEALPRARALIETGQHRNRFPADQQGFCYLWWPGASYIASSVHASR